MWPGCTEKLLGMPRRFSLSEYEASTMFDDLIWSRAASS